ncbi:hypothetical protein [Microbacterium sp. NPDC089695]|uniref:hypothetical protein n=1 Tax=Microbacterium sp. NPDC089695 TaxID=3364198 RepID=UPI00380AF6ED
MNARPQPPREQSPQLRAAALKERVYVTFTALAVVLAMLSHSADLTVGGAATTLTISVLGTALAVFVADFVSHIAVHQHLPTAAETRDMIGTSASALAVLPVPLLTLGGAALDWWSLTGALTAAMWVLLGTLIVIGYLAIRRVRLPWWQRLVVLGAEAVLGAAVIALELIAHG